MNANIQKCRTLVAGLTALTAVMIATAIATADPIVGRDILKFSQEPMLNTQLTSPNGTTFTFHGHDELSTAYSVIDTTGQIAGYRGQFMADDFADTFSSPVVHVKWWGSYIHRPPTPAPGPGVQKFLISFESDIPAPAGGGFSRPGTPLLNQIVTLDTDNILTPGEGTFTEKIVWPNSVDGPIYEYNAELHLGKDFPQKPDTVYWLKVVALVDSPPNIPSDQRLQWGWHNRDYTQQNPLASPNVSPGERSVGQLPTLGGPTDIWHFQDDAVTGFVNVLFNPADPMSQIMPLVQQDVQGPTRYLPPFDGPTVIGQFSKDLAFELYTVPEPASLLLLVAAAGMFAGLRRPV